MLKIHHGGKMGDLLYALPVLRALARIKQEKIHLTTSGHCWQLVPLLWEQPYFGAVELDESRPYELVDGVMSGWDFYGPGEGLNLSLQPGMKSLADPSWTHIYMRLCGVEQLLVEDAVALPSLVNHRRWHTQIKVTIAGVPQIMPKVFVVAPEVETLTSASLMTWIKVMDRLVGEGTVLLVGKSTQVDFKGALTAWQGRETDRLVDLRGCTTVPTMARLIAEATGFIGAHSFPWHVARHSETPAVCLQTWQDGLYRCKVIDTPSYWLEPEAWEEAVKFVLHPQPVQEGEPQ